MAQIGCGVAQLGCSVSVTIRLRRGSVRGGVAQLGCRVAQSGYGVACSMAQLGCGVAQLGCRVAQSGYGVTQLECSMAQLGCGVGAWLNDWRADLPTVRQARVRFPPSSPPLSQLAKIYSIIQRAEDLPSTGRQDTQQMKTFMRIIVYCTLRARGRILGCDWDKSQMSFPPCCSQSPLLTN